MTELTEPTAPRSRHWCSPGTKRVMRSPTMRCGRPTPWPGVTIIPAKVHDGVVELAGRGEAWLFEVDDDLAEAFSPRRTPSSISLATRPSGCSLGWRKSCHSHRWGAGITRTGTSPPSAHGTASTACGWNLATTWRGPAGVVLERPDVQTRRHSPRCGPAAAEHGVGRRGRGDRARRFFTCERPELPLGWPGSDEDAEGEAFSWSHWQKHRRWTRLTRPS